MNKILISIIAILLVVFLGVSIYAYQQQVIKAQTCTDMGYAKTEQDCPTGFVRCMYDLSKVYCRNTGA